MSPVPGSGAMTEVLTLQTWTPPVLNFTLTRSASVATVTTAAPHAYLSTDYVTILTASAAGYAGTHKITVTGASTFTFPCSPSLAASASGTVQYLSDASGGRRDFWADIADIAAEMIPVGTAERLEREAVQSRLDYRFRVYQRPDLTASMRAQWTPSYGGPTQTLKMTGPPLPVDTGRLYLYLELAAVPV